MEAETAEFADGSGLAALVGGAESLRRILDDEETVFFGQRHDWVHVSHQTIQMNDDDGFRIGQNQRLDGSG